jgi:hypothetical protein
LQAPIQAACQCRTGLEAMRPLATAGDAEPKVGHRHHPWVKGTKGIEADLWVSARERQRLGDGLEWRKCFTVPVAHDVFLTESQNTAYPSPKGGAEGCTQVGAVRVRGTYGI